MPVASKSFWSDAGFVALEDLAKLRLIHLDSIDRSWTTWEEWFTAQGYSGTISPGVRVNNYTIALQAAQDSAGVALGWRRLIAPLLKTGALTPLDMFSLPSPDRFYVVSRPDNELSTDARQLRDWVLGDVKAER